MLQSIWARGRKGKVGILQSLLGETHLLHGDEGRSGGKWAEKSTTGTCKVLDRGLLSLLAQCGGRALAQADI